MKRWTKRPDGSNWGDLGEDDQIGRLNLITAGRGAMIDLARAVSHDRTAVGYEMLARILDGQDITIDPGTSCVSTPV